MEKMGCILHSGNPWHSHDGHLVAPDDFKQILAGFLHEATCPGKDKLLAILNQHWWGNFKKTAEIIFGSCVTCDQHNPEKTVKKRHGQESLDTFKWFLSSSHYPWDLFIFRVY